MPNTCNYAEQWSSELLEALIQNTITSPFITNNVKWLSAKTFHFTRMSTTGYKPHSRNGGWNRGVFTQTDVPYTLTHDRDVEFLVDVLDVYETNATASIQNISRTFETTQAAPETDALFFSKVAAAAKASSGYSTSSADSAWTKTTVYGKIKAILASGNCGLVVDNIYGVKTRTAIIKGLQNVLNVKFKAGLVVDGIFGKATKVAVRPLKRGAYGSYPSILQAFLICRGYDTGGFDGIFGNKTESAVKKFQTDNHLTVDGIAGKETFAHLAMA